MVCGVLAPCVFVLMRVVQRFVFLFFFFVLSVIYLSSLFTCLVM